MIGVPTGALDFCPATTQISLHLTRNGQQTSTPGESSCLFTKVFKKMIRSKRFCQRLSRECPPQKKNLLDGFCQYQIPNLDLAKCQGCYFPMMCVGLYSSCICHMPSIHLFVFYLGFMCFFVMLSFWHPANKKCKQDRDGFLVRSSAINNSKIYTGSWGVNMVLLGFLSLQES